MAFPNFQTEDGSALATDNTTHALNHDAFSPSAGDLVLGLFGTDGVPTHTWGSPFTELTGSEQAAASSAATMSLGYNIFDVGDSNSWNNTTSVSEMMAYSMVRITGWYGSVAGIEAAYATGTSSTPDPPNLTPSWGAADTLWIAGYVADSNRTVSSYPTNYTAMTPSTGRRANNTNGVNLGWGYRQNNASSENPGTFTISGSDQWVAFTIAIRPAGGTVHPSTLSGSVGFSGATVKRPARSLAGALSFSGVVSSVKLVAKVLTASLGFSGAISRSFARAIAATLGFTGNRSGVRNPKPAYWNPPTTYVEETNPNYATLWDDVQWTDPVWNGPTDDLVNTNIDGSQTSIGPNFGTPDITEHVEERFIHTLSGEEGWSLGSYDPPNAGTIFLRMRPSSLPSVARLLGFADGFELRSDASGLLYNELFLPGTTTASSSGYNTDRFYNLLFDWDFNGTNVTRNIYIDNTNVLSETVTGTDPGSGTLELGRRFGTTGQSYQGDISTFYWWNRVLTSGERALLEQDPWGMFRQSSILQKVLTATLTFTGAISRQAYKTLSGAISPAGNLLKRPARALTGTLSFSGAWSRIPILVRTFTASISPSAALGRAANRVLVSGPAVMDFTGSIIAQNIIARAFTATLGLAGSISKTAGKTLAASISFTGAISRRIGHSIEQSIGFTGELIRTTAHNMAGTISPSGTLGLVKSAVRAFTASLGFVGTVSRSTSKGLAGAITPAGAIVRSARKNLVGTISPSGAIRRSISRALEATLSPSGALKKGMAEVMTATLSFSGAISRFTTKWFNATVAPAGNLVKSSARAISASLGPTGAIAKITNKAFEQVQTFATGFSAVLNGGAEHFEQGLSAMLDFTASVTKSTSRSLAGALSFAGSFGRIFPRVLSATLTFGTSLSRSINRSISASLSYAGGLSRVVGKRLSATLTSSGNLVANLFGTILKSLTASLSFAGSVSRSSTHGIAATLTTAGQMTRRAGKNLSGVLTSSGALATFRYANAIFTASVSFTGSVSRGIYRNINAALTPVGSMVKRVSRSIGADVVFSTVLDAFSALSVIMNATLNLSSDLRSVAQKRFNAVLATSGQFSRSVIKSFSAVLSPVGLLTRKFIGIITEPFREFILRPKQAGRMAVGGVNRLRVSVKRRLGR